MRIEYTDLEDLYDQLQGLIDGSPLGSEVVFNGQFKVCSHGEVDGAINLRSFLPDSEYTIG